MKVSRRIEAVFLTILLACLGALGLRAATQGAFGFAPDDACVGNARLLALAITQYAQNNDEFLPPTDTQAHFQVAVLPFVHDPAVFLSPADGKPFVPNPAISGKSLAAVGAPEAVELFRDAPPTGSPITIAYLDQHIERGGVEQGDPNLIVSQRARQLSLGVIQYKQDNDEFLPPMNTVPEFQAAVYPYIHSQRVFYSPNGKPFIPNAALSGVPEYSITDPAHTVLLQDQQPYVGGVPTIVYANGRTLHGQDGSASDSSNLKQIELATVQYAQDSDENLPPTNDYGAFESALLPYIQNQAVFANPDTGLPYTLNAAISGASLASITDPSTTELMRDSRLNPDGTRNIAFLDGHIEEQLSFVPRALLTTPDDGTRLFWPKERDQAAFWALTPAGDTVTENAFTLDKSDRAAAFSVGGSGQISLLWNRTFSTSYFDLPITGAITLETIGTDNSVESAARYGPYDGWTPLLLATAPDDTSRLLWRRYDGTFALWDVSPEGDYLGYVNIPRGLNKTPLGMARGSDDLTHILGKTSAGVATLFTYYPTDQLQSMASFVPHHGFTITALAVGADNQPRLLWDNGAGQAEVWTLSLSGAVSHTVRFSLASGYTASHLAVGQAGDLRVLWTASNGSGRLQTLDSNGKVIGVHNLAPYR